MTIDALMVHMARDVAWIVRGYLSPIVKLTRPFRPRHCMVCGAAHRREKTNLCNAHAGLCGVCGGPHPKYSERGFNCARCVKDFPWLRALTDPMEHMMARLYAHRDELDFGKLDECATAIHAHLKLLCADIEAAQDAHDDCAYRIGLGQPGIDEIGEIKLARSEAINVSTIYRTYVFNRVLAAMEDAPYHAHDAIKNYVPPKRAEKKMTPLAAGGRAYGEMKKAVMVGV